MHAERKHFIDAMDDNNDLLLTALENKMEYFYKQKAFDEGYWEEAAHVNSSWNEDAHPYHRDLISRIKDNEMVIDFGCGSANFLVNARKNIHYTGFDISDDQVLTNRKTFPGVEFVVGDITKKVIYPQSADWAISLFVLEHLARPHLLIQNMVKSLKPGGRLAIICPNFTHGMNSIRSGFRTTTKLTKLRKWQFLDFFCSLIDEKLLLPRMIHSIHKSKMQFPVYLRPRCLDAPFYSDNDAIHLVSEQRVIEYIKSLNLKIQVSSKDIANDGSTLYIVAEK